MVIPRQGEQSLVEIISYMGYSPPKCTCNGNQTHSRKYVILLECLHVMDENVTHPIPYPESSSTPSHMQVAKYELLSFSDDNPRFLLIFSFFITTIYLEFSVTPSSMHFAMNENRFQTKVFVFNRGQPSDINSRQTPIIYFVDNPPMYINWADFDD